MKKLIMLFFVLTIASVTSCQPTNVDIGVNWASDSTATQYIIAIAEGSDTTSWPISEDMSWYDVDTTQLSRIFYVDKAFTNLNFSSSINGEYIQAAGIVVGEIGLTSLLTLSNMERKPNVPNKMQFINLNIIPLTKPGSSDE